MVLWHNYPLPSPPLADAILVVMLVLLVFFPGGLSGILGLVTSSLLNVAVLFGGIALVVYVLTKGGDAFKYAAVALVATTFYFVL